MNQAIRRLLSARPGTVPDEKDFHEACCALRRSASCDIYRTSLITAGAKLYFLTHGPHKKLGIAWMELGEAKVRLRELTHQVAAEIRKEHRCFGPALVGLRTSIGFGDRLGLATPGHVRAVKGSSIFPVFAQQSVHEMSLMHRSPEDVVDAATWGAMQEGYHREFGADADHLRTPDDIDICAAAGFTILTIDACDHINNAADTMDAAALEQALARVPWGKLETNRADTSMRYAGKTIDVEDYQITFTDEQAARMAVKFGAAIAYAADMCRHAETQMVGRSFEIEISLDESESPTTPAEHYYIASELGRLGVHPVVIAPHFIGSFEKAVDYRGDIAEFEKHFRIHAAIARTIGPYKIGVHTGSEKFSLYGIIAEHSQGLVHLKTSGTTYLESMRTIAECDPALFREIVQFAEGRWLQDRVGSRVSYKGFPPPEESVDDELPKLLDDDAVRQLLHVTFGSVMTARLNGGYLFREKIYNLLGENEPRHYELIEQRLRRHVEPFSAPMHEAIMAVDHEHTILK